MSERIPTENSARSVHLVLRILAARTKREIASADRAAHAYLQEHPEDDNIRYALEQLGMMADAVDMTLPDHEDLGVEERSERPAEEDL